MGPFDLHKAFILLNLTDCIKNKKDVCCKGGNGACGGAVYGLGFLGAAVYYISNAGGFWAGVLGFLKALVWPAFVVYELLKFLGI